MYSKPILAMRINDDIIVPMTCARSLKAQLLLLALPIGCLA